MAQFVGSFSDRSLGGFVRALVWDCWGQFVSIVRGLGRGVVKWMA